MLFNSFTFLLGYLPVTALLFFVLARVSHTLAAVWLTMASLAFYGWWNVGFVPLLAGSIAFNYAVGLALCSDRARSRQRLRRGLLLLGVGADLALLAWYKYAGFLATNINELVGSTLDPGKIILPLGISFFTFTQIAFLVDAYRDEAREYNPIHYGLFVTYFPHLIAGPVLHHREMMPQFGHGATYRFQWPNMSLGLTLLVIGLFKKVVIADGMIGYVSAVFGADGVRGVPDVVMAWRATAAYTLQIYFDFSGYSDMAIGLSQMFGIRLPLNFDSPYKAASIVEFWRRWHMTLSRFLRDYLYIPLGGNRHGTARRYANLMTTMLLGGLWHGAGWTFVIWGGLHGAYLMINHAWQAAVARHADPRRRWPWAWAAASRAITLFAVMLAWVFFRSPDVAGARAVLAGMAGFNGVAPLDRLAAARMVVDWAWIALGFAIALWMPNSQEVAGYSARRARSETEAGERSAAGHPRPEPGRLALAGRAGVTKERHDPAPDRRWLVWRPGGAWALVVGSMLVIVLARLNRPTEFIYFQF
jgi:D-alanyl-lipoteichoic acid acyltransferase DltB (MBOAT superfamily)